MRAGSFVPGFGYVTERMLTELVFTAMAGPADSGGAHRPVFRMKDGSGVYLVKPDRLRLALTEKQLLDDAARALAASFPADLASGSAAAAAAAAAPAATAATAKRTLVGVLLHALFNVGFCAAPEAKEAKRAPEDDLWECQVCAFGSVCLA